ncbi:porin [Chelatococcus sp. SYSU_G07232]|uniref:Porin n=1 Tax=Chelatococcus albus TaxID=3047466 RepID=A0ABT7AJV2_9HYPH|nr:porin [Chelatococcus sp. SYSU_G07232]MDJ1159661.1 porin [Chelatococcus sp. SYSU_G07232]
MKLVKSLLLGSAAGFAAVAGAQAADLPMKKAAPVEYVRVCSTHGAGFFYIPGTDTCIRIGGRVRAEYRYQEPLWSVPGNGRNVDAIGFRARGRLNVDARTSTAYGTLRAFFRYELTSNTGVYGGNSARLDKAFIQWAGITAGATASFFDFYADDLNWSTGPLAGFGSDNGTTNLLAYTATFGSGFSATLSLEDRNQRTVQGAGFANYAQAGERVPDVVAALRVDQGWGSAQLSGAVHQLNSTNIGAGFVGAGVGSGALGSRSDTEYGFAVQGGVKVNLPQLAPGDVLWLQAAYADGALNYLGVGSGTTIGALTGTATDGVLVNGDIKKTKGWNVTAAFQHYWTPSIRQALFGTYTSIDFSSSTVAATTIGGVPALRDFKVYSIGSNLIWSPVSAFDIGVEVLYSKLDPSGRVAVAPGRTRGSEDVWEARLRLQRDF